MHSINSYEICLAYLATLSDKKAINDTKNALIRYFIPSVGGPSISAAKRRPIDPKEAESSLQFLHHVSLEQLADAPDWALKTLEEKDSSTTQKEVVRRFLRNIVDWAREKEYLPLPEPSIPPGICEHIQLGVYHGLNLKPATALSIYTGYIKTLSNPESKTDISNAIIRYFVPATGGPSPLHKPASNPEVKAALKHLERTPLEYLNEAYSIVKAALEFLNLSETQKTRIRSAIGNLVEWARKQEYLPNPNLVAHWGGEYISNIFLPSVIDESQEKPLTVLETYNLYCGHLRSNGKEQEVKSLQSIIVRYLVPACGGTAPSGNRATQLEIQASINYLGQISLEQLHRATELIEPIFDQLNVEKSNRYTPRSRLVAWIDWCSSQGYFQSIIAPQAPQPVFNTFRKVGVHKVRKSPGRELYKNSCPTHVLGAKQFPDDYINQKLEKQIRAYKAWRLANNVREGGLKTEEEQILQVLGWLHRYEDISLEDLSFECLITKSQLLFLAYNYTSFEDYLLEKEKGVQKSRQEANNDIQRIQRYLDFVGKHPNSQKKRLSVIIAMSKFVYRDLIGTDDFPQDRDIPIIRRLLKLQIELAAKAKSVPSTISYHETSITWSEAIMTLEKQRLRAEQGVIYLKCDRYEQGYYERRRANTSIAHELQRFLSIAFCLLVPSRSRTFYDLRIGETFKEGILTKTKFFSVEELKSNGNWEQCKNDVKFYIHHHADDYKTGKSMAHALLNNGGWWVELPNIKFGEKCLYDYIYRWLNWGRNAQGVVNHNFFFHRKFNAQPLDYNAWAHRIKNIFACWTGVPVPPNSIRKMFASHFSELKEEAALLLQHSERIHETDYDMRHSINKMQTVLDANQLFMEQILSDLSD